jgi:integrase
MVGLTNVHVHDLRHAGNVLVADVGANLRELMESMGHSTTRAALIYLHGGDDRRWSRLSESNRRPIHYE